MIFLGTLSNQDSLLDMNSGGNGPMRTLTNADNKMFDYKTISKLENEFGPSFYVLNVDKLRENYKKSRLHLKVDTKTLLSDIHIKQTIFHFYVKSCLS